MTWWDRTAPHAIDDKERDLARSQGISREFAGFAEI
jgi:hypothetical protein